MCLILIGFGVVNFLAFLTFGTHSPPQLGAESWIEILYISMDCTFL